MGGRRGGKNRESLGARLEEGWVENGNLEMQNVGALVINKIHLDYKNTKQLIFQG